MFWLICNHHNSLLLSLFLWGFVGGGDQRVLDTFIYALFGSHTAILTLSQHQLINVIKPVVNSNIVRSHGMLAAQSIDFMGSNTLNLKSDSRYGTKP